MSVAVQPKYLILNIRLYHVKTNNSSSRIQYTALYADDSQAVIDLNLISLP